MRTPVGKIQPIHILEDVLNWPPMYSVRTLKAPSDPEFAFKALYAFCEGLPSDNT